MTVAKMQKDTTVPKPVRLDIDSNGTYQSAVRIAGGDNMLGTKYETSGSYHEKCHREALGHAERATALSVEQKQRLRKRDVLGLQADELDRVAVDEPGRRKAVDARRALAAVSDAFDTGGQELRDIGTERGDKERAACAAVAGMVIHYIAALGKQVQKVIDPDLVFYMYSPVDAPAELDGLHREAVRVSEMADRLGVPGGMTAFWKGCGDVGEHVVTEKLHLDILPPPRFVRTSTAAEL